MFPKLLQFHGFFLPTYGVLVALAFLAGLWLTVRLAKHAGLDPEAITNLAVYCALAGLAGAKLFMVLFNFRDYASDPSSLFKLETLQAAGVYQGGLILALIVAVWYVRKMRLPMLETFDVFAPGIALGHAIGRLGCFAAGCCWGGECDRPWAVVFHSAAAHELTGVPLDMPLHPTQLYESGAEALICLFLLWRIRRAHAPGAVFGTYMILYSVARFLVEFVRNHEQPVQLGMSLTQWISLGTLALGVWLVLRQAQKRLAHS